MNNIFALAGVVIKELYRRKDFYVLFVMTAVVSLLLGSVRFFNDDKIVRFIKAACLLLIWISTLVIAITTAARQIPAERESRTIFPLLAKPVSRWELIAGKFFGCWLACGITLVVFYLFFGLLTSSYEHHWPVATFFQGIWMHWVFLAIVIALVLLGSVVFTAQSSNATISFIVVVGILFAGRHLHYVGLGMNGFGREIVTAVYYAIPHLEWYDMRDLVIHDWAQIDWIYIAGATLYGALYTGLLLGLTWMVFRRKTLTL
ncbi:MAG: ABC transporter permease [Verrucomicrobiota bacterium]|jgi:ABC-type transport system involved in multi-copper enzyme maturation permease subunit